MSIKFDKIKHIKSISRVSVPLKSGKIIKSKKEKVIKKQQKLEIENWRDN